MRRRMMGYNKEKKYWGRKKIGDIIRDESNTSIGIVAYKTSDRLGVMALERRSGISAFGTSAIISSVSSRVAVSYPNDNASLVDLPSDDYAGLQNTKEVVRVVGNSTNYGAGFCLNYNLGSCDWYLPTVSEIRWLWINKDAINAALSSLGRKAWTVRNFTGTKDIEMIISSTNRIFNGVRDPYVFCIRLNENGRIFSYVMNQNSAKEVWGAGYSVYTSVYPFFSKKI